MFRAYDRDRLNGLPSFQLASALGVLMLPDLLRTGRPFWLLGHAAEAPLLVLAFVAALWAGRLAGGSRWRSVAAGVLVLALAGAATLAVNVMAPGIQVSRMSAGLALVFSGVFLLGGHLLTATLQRIVATTVVLGLAALLVSSRRPADEDFAAPPARSSRVLFSAYYPLTVTDHDRVVSNTDLHIGGALAVAGSRVIAMTGLGALYVLDWNGESSTVVSTRLPLELPSNFREFEASADPQFERSFFRSQDVQVRAVEAGWQLFVTHHRWSQSRSCVSMVLSTSILNPALDVVVQDWRSVIELNPCLPLGGPIREGAAPFEGLESGGRMEWLSDRELLLTTGDHAFDGVNRVVAAAQDDAYDYGKSLIIDVESSRARRFTKGHRNPQGLLINKDGRVWSTEHGPRGGDELNLLRAGANYGWPYATQGTDYGQFSWPLTDVPHPDRGRFVPPVFTWTPSIGVSNLVAVTGDRFPRWRGDLLVGSIRGRALYRLSVVGDHVQQTDEIRIGTPVRDVIEAPTGDIWIWGDDGNLITVAPDSGSPDATARLIHCANCHSGAAGPDLTGILNRPVASDSSFAGYTDGLRAVGGVWTPSRLDEFLEDPTFFAPGTVMTYSVPNAAERAAIVAFLMAQ